jgi:NAD(P)H dehydrogenase (quinone)
MNILVLYHSRGGNTKALAQAVAQGVDALEGVTAILKTCEQVTKEDFLAAKGIIAGSPVYFGGMAAELKQVFDSFVSTRRKMEGKVGAVFTTSGDATGGKETTMMGIIQAFMIYGMIVTGDPMAATGHYGVACVGKPDDKTIGNAKLLGERVGQIALKLFGAQG